MTLAPFFKKPRQLFIGGQWVDSVSGEYFDSIDPSTGLVLGQVARGGAEDIDRAVVAARTAFNGDWQFLLPFDRQHLMLRLAAAIDKRFDELAVLESCDMGAPITRTTAYRRWIQQMFHYYAGQVTQTRGEIFANSIPGDPLSYSLKLPLGVAGAIIPWNAPLISQLWSICPMLATGCTLVLKPAEEAALSPLLIAEIMSEAGLPAGVLNVVPGPGSTAGARLAEHPDVDRISFTGSTDTGKKIVKASAESMKRVSVELGGKSPNIIFADADLKAAAIGAAMACFNNSGQVCFAGTRLLVQRAIYDAFVEQVAAVGRELHIGPALNPATQLGPLASAAQLDRVSAHLASARKEGAEIVSGGTRLSGEFENGYFIQPTVIAGVTNQMKIAQEEVFGPVLAAIPFDEEEEAIRIANETPYGLGSGIWSRDVGRIQRVSRSIRAGMTWANCYGLMDPATTFTGTKLSGYGVKGGPSHIDEYLLTKTIWSSSQP